MNNNNIVLCGLPGVGKTTVGRELAKVLHREFIDTDTLVEEKCGLSCREYFTIYGEEAFRRVEEDVLLSLERKTPIVIALGGGVVEIPNAIEIVARLGTIVHITEDIEMLIERKIYGDKPATAGDEITYKILANRRLPLFGKIRHIEICCRNKPVGCISKEIIREVSSYHGK